MSAESLKTPQPGETVRPNGFILPPERTSNVRESKTYDNLSYRSDKYNSPGVDPENPYNAFAPRRIEVTAPDSAEQQAENPEKANAQTEVLEHLAAENQQLRAEMDELKKRFAELQSATKELAEKQPRRVRHENGVTERLVKFADGTFEWQVISIDEAAADIKDEKLTDPEKNAKETEDSEKQAEVVNLKIGDRVQYKDRNGNVIEGVLESTADLDNEDYVIYHIRTDDGELKPVSFAYLSQVAKVVGGEGDPDSGDKSDIDKLDDIKFPEPGEKGERGSWKPEISQELESKIQEAIDKYAEATAKNRNGYLGHFLHNSKFLAKIPLVGKLLKGAADKLNQAHDAKELGPARAEYREAMIAIQDEIKLQVMEAMKGQEETEIIEAARKLANDAAMQYEVALETKILGKRMELSGKTNRFVDWWVRNDSLGGKFKKAGIVVGTSLAAGAVIGLAGAPVILGSVAGAGIGAGVGAYISKKRASGQASKGAETTLAQKQGTEDASRKANYVKQQAETEGAFVDIDELIGVTEDRTGDEKVGNRRRTKGLAAAGAAAGGVGAGVGEAIRAGLENIPAPEAEPHVDDKPEIVPDIEVPQYDNISILDNEGGTEAIQRLFGADAEQARAIWDQVFSQYGTNPLDHSSVGGGMMPDIIQVGGGNYGWSHEGWLSSAMTDALNAAARNVMG